MLFVLLSSPTRAEQFEELLAILKVARCSLFWR